MNKYAQKLSSIAGILDPYGGLRIVITTEDFNNHARPYEMVLVVPDLLIQEPVPWEMFPSIVKTVERYVDWWIATRNDPDLLSNDCVVFRKLRMSRGHCRGSVNLYDIAYT